MADKKIKKELENLKKQKTEHDLLLKNIPGVVWKTDSTGETLFISSRVKKVYGYTPEEIYAGGDKVWLDRIHPDDIDALLKAFKEIFTKDKALKVEYRIKRKDGQWIWLKDQSIGAYKADGKKYAYGFFTDVSKEKETQEKLEQNRIKLKEARKIANIGYWWWDIETGKVEWSEEVYRIFKLDPKKFTPQINSIMALSPWPENNKRDKELIAKTKKSHKPGSYEQKFLFPDKSTGYYFSTFRGQYDKNNKLIAIAGTIQDITKQKKSEQAVKNSEEKYRTLFNNSKDAFMALEPPHWKFTSSNPSAIRMFGAKNEKEITSLKPWDISPKYQPDGQLSSSKAKKMIHTALKNGSHFFEWTHKKIKGGNFCATVLLTKISLGEKTFLQSTVRDITKQKEAEEKLKESENILNSFFNHTQEYMGVIEVIEKNNDLRYVKINKAAEKYIGYSPEKIKGMLASQVGVSKKVIKKWIEEYQKCKTTKLPGKFEYSRETAGGLHALSTSISIIKPPYLAFVVSDISKQKRIEKRLLEINELKTEFLSIAAHQLRTPLGKIRWTLEDALKRDKHTNTDCRESIEEAHEDAKKIILLVNDLLNISRIEQGKANKQSKKLDLMKTTRKVVKSIKNQAKQKKLIITIKKGSATNYWVKANLEQLEESIKNLISNAIKYSKDKNEIVISLEKGRKWTRVKVRDWGVGIPKEDLDKISEKFFRATNASINDPAGSGLGLYVARSFVENWGGKITWQSKEGEGSTFTISLPTP